jgi:peptide/nickel transport system substrate-binding protein
MRCDLSKGIQTDDAAGIVTIRLRARDPDFLEKLAMTFASIVPAGTPAQDERPRPGTGPYRIATYVPNRYAKLVRNPYFREWSKAAQPAGLPDEIVLDQPGSFDEAAATVQHGRADYVPHVSTERLHVVRTLYAAQLHVTPLPGTYYLVLDPHQPPFNDIRARRALAFAVDRARVVDAWGGRDASTPTCQLLPPSFPSYEPYCPFTAHAAEDGPWTAPDLARARKLVEESGTKGMRVDVLGLSGRLPLAATTTVLVDTLHELGYRTRVERKSRVGTYFDTLHAAKPRVDAALGAWSADYPSPSGFLRAVLACTPLSPYPCDPDLDRRIHATLDVQARNPRGAPAAWIRLERRAIDEAMVVPLVNPKTSEFVSKRVGNYQFHPILGMLISQAWVR